MIMNRINRILCGEKSLSLVCIDQENSYPHLLTLFLLNLRDN